MFEGPDLMNSIFFVITLVISVSLVTLFDSTGTLVGAARQSGLVDENEKRIKRVKTEVYVYFRPDMRLDRCVHFRRKNEV